MKKTTTKKAPQATANVKEPELFVIIDLTNRPGGDIEFFQQDSALIRLHHTAGEAMAEAFRLSRLFPRCNFALFRCIGFMLSPIPEPKFREIEMSDVRISADF